MRLWRSAIARFLGLFPEVRRLRSAESKHYMLMQERYASEALFIKDLAAVRGKLAETESALAVMTEARLNSDRTADTVSRSAAALRETHEAEIHRLQQMVDAFALSSAVGRQVFGTAPSGTREISPEAQQPVVSGIQGRRLVEEAQRQAYLEAQAAREKFFQEAAAYMEQMQQGSAPPDAEPVYSSTARAV